MTEFHVTIAGNIGVGKSTLTKLMAEELGWSYYLEPETRNPFLEDFYEDMLRWSFHSQMFFFVHRLIQHLRILELEGSVIQDRSIYEDAEIFARNLFERRQMPPRDYSAYQAMYEGIKAVLKPPDVAVYLQAEVETLQKRIKTRGRHYEQDMPADYLARLNDLYEQWSTSFDRCPVLTVNVDKLDFFQHPELVGQVAQQILESLA